MTKRQFGTLMLLTVVAGFLGGAVSDRLLRGDPSAAAQGAPPPPVVPGEVTATRFRLVDAAGKGLAFLDVDAKGLPQLGVYDAAGTQRVSLGVDADGSPRLGMLDAAGKVIWRAP